MKMARSRSHVVVLLIIAVFGALSLAAVSKKRHGKPNIVYILTDDQDLHLNSMDLMENLQKQLVQEGTFFNNHYGHVSQCCPARATILTGKHAHNTNVTAIYNDIAGGGWVQFQKYGWHKKNIGVWMQKAGYSTYYTGKILNGFNEGNYCEPNCWEGWSKADLFLGPTTYYYYNTKFGHFDGNSWTKVKGNKTDYSTDQVAHNVANFIEESAGKGEPFFAIAAPVAPHIPSFPKEEYKELYPDLKLPRPPNFNPENRTGVATIWRQSLLTDSIIERLENAYRKRQRTLKSVDDLVDTIVKKLKETGTIDNTYIVYSTDNGYHMGNHRLRGGKMQCFEEDINIPLIIRGPDVAKGKKTNLVTGHIDIVPTFLSLAGYGDSISKEEIGLELDGTPISFPLESDSDFERNMNARGETTHLEFWGVIHQEWAHSERVAPGKDLVNTYKALRLQGPNYSLLYSVWCMDSAHELYDMTWDPYQMSNLHPDAPTEGNATNPYNSGHNMMLGRPIELLVQRLDAVVLVLKTCIGDQCRWPWKQLHPNGQVNTLMDALDPQYDSFYAHTYKVAQVGWEECYWGYNHKSDSDGGPMDSTCYNIENEQPTWIKASVLEKILGTNDSCRPSVTVNWLTWLLAWAGYLGLKPAFGC